MAKKQYGRPFLVVLQPKMAQKQNLKNRYIKFVELHTEFTYK